MSEELSRVMGIDYGTTRVGVAISDPLRIIAQPVTMLENNTRLVAELMDIAETRNVKLVVIGMPYAPDGGKGAMAKAVDEFVNTLKSALQLPVVTWDESNSSTSAQQVFIEGGMKKKQRRAKGNIDIMAARLMLQEYLDSHASDK